MREKTNIIEILSDVTKFSTMLTLLKTGEKPLLLKPAIKLQSNILNRIVALQATDQEKIITILNLKITQLSEYNKNEKKNIIGFYNIFIHSLNECENIISPKRFVKTILIALKNSVDLQITQDEFIESIEFIKNLEEYGAEEIKAIKLLIGKLNVYSDSENIVTLGYLLSKLTVLERNKIMFAFRNNKNDSIKEVLEF
jgi:hypothetical protein